MNLFLVAGARPNFMKIAPIVRALKAQSDPQITQIPRIEYKIVHTGQHYDYEMSQAFFDDLEIPKPDFFLEAGSGLGQIGKKFTFALNRFRHLRGRWDGK